VTVALFDYTCARCDKPFRSRDRKAKFCSRRCFHDHKNDLQRTKGGHRGITKQGYVRLTLPNGERVLEHRHVYEQAHGVKLENWQIVHHINEIKTDNRPENLRLTGGLSEHNREHGGSLRWGEGVPLCSHGHGPKEGVTTVNGRLRKYCKVCNRENVARYKITKR
jgi:hypothetical protein